MFRLNNREQRLLGCFTPQITPIRTGENGSVAILLHQPAIDQDHGNGRKKDIKSS